MTCQRQPDTNLYQSRPGWTNDCGDKWPKDPGVSCCCSTIRSPTNWSAKMSSHEGLTLNQQEQARIQVLNSVLEYQLPIAQLRRQRARQIIVEGEYAGNSAVFVRCNSMPFIQWPVGQPVLLVCPLRTASSVVESHQGLPTSLRFRCQRRVCAQFGVSTGRTIWMGNSLEPILHCSRGAETWVGSKVEPRQLGQPCQRLRKFSCK